MLPEVSDSLNRNEPACLNYTSKHEAGVQPRLTFLFIGTPNTQYLPFVRKIFSFRGVSADTLKTSCPSVRTAYSVQSEPFIEKFGWPVDTDLPGVRQPPKQEVTDRGGGAPQQGRDSQRCPNLATIRFSVRQPLAWREVRESRFSILLRGWRTP